jgi:hypothetical protein
MAVPRREGESDLTHTSASAVMVRLAWALTAAICLFTMENVWIDPWSSAKFHHKLPSLVPEPLGGIWISILGALGFALLVTILCLVLIVRDIRIATWQKTLTGLAVFLSLLLMCEWFLATGGADLVAQVRKPHRDHSVTLHWNPSTTTNVRYNIYRGQKPGSHPDKVSSDPIEDTTYTDTTVDNGAKYYYVVRAVNSAGRESVDSNEVPAKIP